MGSEDRGKGARRGRTPYNPLTGNRLFFGEAGANRGDDAETGETRSVEPPVYQGSGQTFWSEQPADSPEPEGDNAHRSKGSSLRSRRGSGRRT